MEKVQPKDIYEASGIDFPKMLKEGYSNYQSLTKNTWNQIDSFKEQIKNNEKIKDSLQNEEKDCWEGISQYKGRLNFWQTQFQSIKNKNHNQKSEVFTYQGKTYGTDAYINFISGKIESYEGAMKNTYQYINLLQSEISKLDPQQKELEEEIKKLKNSLITTKLKENLSSKNTAVPPQQEDESLGEKRILEDYIKTVTLKNDQKLSFSLGNEGNPGDLILDRDNYYIIEKVKSENTIVTIIHTGGKGSQDIRIFYLTKDQKKLTEVFSTNRGRRSVAEKSGFEIPKDVEDFLKKYGFDPMKYVPVDNQKMSTGTISHGGAQREYLINGEMTYNYASSAWLQFTKIYPQVHQFLLKFYGDYFKEMYSGVTLKVINKDFKKNLNKFVEIIKEVKTKEDQAEQQYNEKIKMKDQKQKELEELKKYQNQIKKTVQNGKSQFNMKQSRIKFNKCNDLVEEDLTIKRLPLEQNPYLIRSKINFQQQLLSLQDSQQQIQGFFTKKQFVKNLKEQYFQGKSLSDKEIYFIVEEEKFHIDRFSSNCPKNNDYNQQVIKKYREILESKKQEYLQNKQK